VTPPSATTMSARAAQPTAQLTRRIRMIEPGASRHLARSSVGAPATDALVAATARSWGSELGARTGARRTRIGRLGAS
jgi:hypothetical protein